MTTQRYPLPKRFNAALSENAYAQLRDLNTRHGFGNNYLLTVLLENLYKLTSDDKLDAVFNDFAAHYGSPKLPAATQKQP